MSEPIEYKKKIGSRIRSLVGEDRGAQAELCRAIGIQTNNLTHYFKGSLPTDPSILEKITDYYGVSLDWLITGRERGVAAEAAAPYGKETHAKEGRLKPRELVVQGVAEKLTPEDLITWMSQGVHFIKSPEEQERAKKDIQALKLLWEGKKKRQQRKKKTKPSTAS